MTTQSEQVDFSEPATVAVQASELMVVLRRERGGPELAREPVVASDVSDLFAELWRDGWLRAGKPGVPYDALSFNITAQLADGAAPKCDKLVFEAADSQGRSRTMAPPTQAFQDVASRAAQSLLAAEILKSEDVYHYELALRSQPPQAPADDEPQFTIRTKNTPLAYLSVPIKPLLARAQAMGSVDKTFPVFYTAEALKSAQRVAQKGADDQPPTETGGVLLGPLCSCPETGEFFVVVCEVLEAKDAEGSTLSLSYTGKTWARIQAIVRAKQSQRNTRAHRIVGQAHGHNLLPGGSCLDCEKRHECKLTSVFVSLDDRTWSKAVFSKQPWHICHIFGLNARGEPVHALFSLKENRLLQRGFYLLPDFDPAREENQHARSD